MYVVSHSESKYVQTEDHTLRQEEFSTPVDEDDTFPTVYGDVDDDHFHHMMQAQDRKFYQSFSDQVFLFHDLCDSQVYEKYDLAVFRSGSTEDLERNVFRVLVNSQSGMKITPSFWTQTWKRFSQSQSLRMRRYLQSVTEV